MTVIKLPMIDPVNKGRVEFPFTDNDLTLAIDYAGGANPVYVGKAKPGTAKGTAEWQIMKFLYSGSDVTDVQWASGSPLFSFEWDERTTYSYS